MTFEDFISSYEVTDHERSLIVRYLALIRYDQTIEELSKTNE